MSKKTYPYFYDPSKKETGSWTAGDGVPAVSWRGEDQSAVGSQKTAKESKTPMEKILGGPVPGGAQPTSVYVPEPYKQATPTAQTKQTTFSNTASVGLDRINTSLNPMLNQNRVTPGAGLPGYTAPSAGGVQLNDAALYDQYRDMYERQGRLAREDAAGRAAAMTGGQANSYADTAGEQTYNAYLDEYDSLLRQIQSGSSESDTGGWYDELLNEEAGDGFTGTTRQEAEAYLASQDIPANELDDLMSPAQWAIKKREGKTGIAEIEFNTYEEYLSAFVEYILDTYEG